MRRLILLVTAFGLIGAALADNAGGKDSYLQVAQSQIDYWRARVTEVLAKRNVFPEGSPQAKALGDVLTELRDEQQHARDTLEDLKSSKDAAWESTKSKIDSSVDAMIKIYKKSTAY